MSGREKLIKVPVDFPESLYYLLKDVARFRGEFSDIIRTGAEKEARERQLLQKPTETKEKKAS